MRVVNGEGEMIQAHDGIGRVRAGALAGPQPAQEKPGLPQPHDGVGGAVKILVPEDFLRAQDVFKIRGHGGEVFCG